MRHLSASRKPYHVLSCAVGEESARSLRERKPTIGCGVRGRAGGGGNGSAIGRVHRGFRARSRRIARVTAAPRGATGAPAATAAPRGATGAPAATAAPRGATGAPAATAAPVELPVPQQPLQPPVELPVPQQPLQPPVELPVPQQPLQPPVELPVPSSRVTNNFKGHTVRLCNTWQTAELSPEKRLKTWTSMDGRPTG